MVYAMIVKKKIRQSFDDVNHHRWDDAVKDMAPDVHHRVSGTHALGGERRGKQAVRRWFERMGRVFPTLRITLDEVWVTGGPWNTTVFARWRASEALLDGRGRYENRGLHVFTLKWGKVRALEEYFDSQAADRALTVQAECGVAEAAAEPIAG
ncbi:ketosteroid isomerase-like protein [Inquilinus ginsengisoli]|uniref:Ketosteroid isomerase-like protein n=1 Tax=Inquilinus ginsengisoli TaxID=363840 RepID=A0ABU1JZM4_9PROT|nr:nuclear transport factor 2 family protein [Inquilinus ginsengisoli]MDR6293783.1 ketosteroid isomerase-like protein [Inquilinus ginsengisoli]